MVFNFLFFHALDLHILPGERKVPIVVLCAAVRVPCYCVQPVGWEACPQGEAGAADKALWHPVRLSGGATIVRANERHGLDK